MRITQTIVGLRPGCRGRHSSSLVGFGWLAFPTQRAYDAIKGCRLTAFRGLNNARQRSW